MSSFYEKWRDSQFECVFFGGNGDRGLVFVGMACSIEPMVKPGENKKVGILKFEAGTLKAGKWKGEKLLNGDEKISIKCPDMPKAYMLELYKY